MYKRQVSPGNSGGGLFNERGELIGIVNAKSSGQNAEGLGFAIPVNTAIQVAEELINNGYVTGRPAMGVTVLSINDAQTAFQYGVNQAGVYVQSVNEGGAADKAGLQPGDRFVSIDGTAVNSTSDITGIIGEHAVGDTIEVQVVALMLITVQGPDGGRAPEGEALAEAMDDLKLAIAGTLRKSDTFTKYSRSQYALLLPMESADDMAVVERRLSAAYESARTQAAAFLEFRGTVLAELYG